MTTKQVKVLIVDDDPQVRSFLKKRLDFERVYL